MILSADTNLFLYAAKPDSPHRHLQELGAGHRFFARTRSRLSPVTRATVLITPSMDSARLDRMNAGLRTAWPGLLGAGLGARRWGRMRRGAVRRDGALPADLSEQERLVMGNAESVALEGIAVARKGEGGAESTILRHQRDVPRSTAR